jgi:hypothetical protein
MALTPSKRHSNWSSVTWTPYLSDGTTPGTPVPWTGVQGIDIDPRGEIIMHSGDGDLLPTTKMFSFADPQVTVTFRDLKALQQAVPGQRGVLTATHGDAHNAVGAGGGGYLLTVARAIVENNPSGGQHRQFGEGRAIISIESVDGITNPMTYAAL